MNNWLSFEGADHSLVLFGVKLVGVNSVNGKKLLFSLVFILLVLVINAALRGLVRLISQEKNSRAAFWTRQGVRVLMTLVMVIGIISIWFNDPARLATVVGLVTAGLAFALQKVVTAVAGYIVILRGKTFNVGDRITMGGVRGDVIALGFIQTTIMEMGQPPAEQNADPAMWVKSRQYTGRIVTVTNDKIFDTPIYNYTRDFPYIWDEMSLPISYKDDRGRAEEILLRAAQHYASSIDKISEDDLREIERRFAIAQSDIKPRVYLRLTDNWIELTVRFITSSHGVRDLKDAMSRQIIEQLDEAGIGIASGTYEIVGFPPVKVEVEQSKSQPPTGDA